MQNARRGLVGWIILMCVLPAGVEAQQAGRESPRNVVCFLPDRLRDEDMLLDLRRPPSQPSTDPLAPAGADPR